MTLRLDVWGALAPALWPSIIAVLFTDLFDSLSTFIGVAEATGFTDDDGRPDPHAAGPDRRRLGDARWRACSAPRRARPTSKVPQASTPAAGPGLTAVVAGLCFLPCLFLAPIAAAVPAFATAPVLIIVGVLMFRTCRTLPFGALEEMVPAFLTLVLIPLTLSITQGLLWGLVAHVVGLRRRRPGRDLTPWHWGLGRSRLGLLYLHG